MNTRPTAREYLLSFVTREMPSDAQVSSTSVHWKDDAEIWHIELFSVSQPGFYSVIEIRKYTPPPA